MSSSPGTRLCRGSFGSSSLREHTPMKPWGNYAKCRRDELPLSESLAQHSSFHHRPTLRSLDILFWLFPSSSPLSPCLIPKITAYHRLPLYRSVPAPTMVKYYLASDGRCSQSHNCGHIHGGPLKPHPRALAFVQSRFGTHIPPQLGLQLP
jgi:hypothetical protein